MKTCRIIAVVLGQLVLSLSALSQLPPPNPNFQLDYWSFNSTNWLSESNCAPMSFTNLENPPDWDGNALEVDSTDAAWLQYPIVSGSLTNITFDTGTICLWVSPNWNSGVGPGDLAQLIDVGAYSTNASSSWWSLYFSPDGSSLNFSSETNDVFTNYFSYPISWNSNVWHFVAVTYDTSVGADLYIDGQLATNGGTMNYVPSDEVSSNGLFVGSDVTGLEQSRALIDDLATYNYAMSEDEITNEYLTGWDLMNGITNSGGGSGNSGNNGPGSGVIVPNYSTNMWVAPQGVSGNTLSIVATNAQQDILYELQGCTNLADPLWTSLGFSYGSELTNCAPFTTTISKQGNLFLRIRSWQDSTGTGIPDWWWYFYFGEITNVNAYASAAGDGYDNLQKYEMGLDPTNYYDPNPPTNFLAYTAGNNVFFDWSPLPGPVVNYEIQRGVLNTETGNYSYTDFLVSSNATNYEDAGVLANPNSVNDIYNLYAVYPGNGDDSGTDTWAISWGNYLLPGPTNLDAYVDTSGTNVLLSWNAVTNSLITGYIIERVSLNFNTYSYVYFTNGIVSNNVTSFEDVGILANPTNWSDFYQVAAVYPGGGLSAYAQSFYDYALPIQVGYESGVAGPTNFYGYGTYLAGYYPYTDTNVYLGWSAVSGSVSNYIIYATSNGIDGYSIYQQLGKVGSGTTSLTVSGGMDDLGNYLYSAFAVVAVFDNGSQSQATFWYPSGVVSGPASFEAYVDSTGTNIILNWSAVPGASGYVIQENEFGDYSPIATNDAATLTYTDSTTIAYFQWIYTNYGFYIDPSNVLYQVQAIFSDGGVSPAATAQVTDTPPPPTYSPATNLTATADGTNVLLNWTAAPGAVEDYIIEEGAYNPQTESYSYTQIGTTTGTSYEDSGGIANPNSYDLSYEVIADYGGGNFSVADSFTLSTGGTPTPTSNISIAAQLVRNETGHWQLMFSSIPTNVDTVAIFWYEWDYWYDFGDPFWLTSEIDIPTTNLTNGIYVVPDWQTTNFVGNALYGQYAEVQPISDGNYGNVSLAGFLPYDEPSYVDGRIPLKQNLLFEVRGATISQPFQLYEYDYYFIGEYPIGIGIPSDTNYVESSIFHWEDIAKGYNQGFAEFTEMDDLWPYTVNYQLNDSLYNPNYTGPSSFVWQTNLDVIPASPVLGIGDPYFIEQNFYDLADVGAYTNNGNLYFESGEDNLFGLPFETALVNEGSVTTTINGVTGLPDYTTNPPIYLATGDYTPYTNADCWFSQTTDPDLVLSNYYFAQVVTPGTALSSENTPVQPAPIPTLTGFDNTNQTQIMVTSVGTPTVAGGWARFAIANGDTMKFAYLGQYYETNAFVITNGVMTTNTTGVVSPYGDFFPTEPGQDALVTMPDIDTGQQGTCAVDVVSLNVDANHDGTMDFSFNGPDYVSANNPYRFWVDDSADDGDYGGDGIPEQGADGNGVLQMSGQYVIHGTRDLVNFFPVYVNIGSLFQSNAFSAGISYTDTNYQYVLSQADGALRFAYTDLTPTNYLNFLQNDDEAENLAYNGVNPDYAQLTTISTTGIVLSNSFVADIATNNGGIILVQAWTNTTEPLVLTIYQGTNQIAQTSLYLSISEVEQMFRSKTILLNPDPEAVPDRLTDESVPNEPTHNGENFVFVTGYNVNPNQARGWGSDIFKRLYWSGSHAKFYCVTWEGYDSQVDGAVTINYQTNVVNAFNTAPLLNSFLNTLSGPNIVAAHSLGNMVVLSALNDYDNQNINTYFMIDAAVATEAIDDSASPNSDMYLSAWTSYESSLWASEWHNLWPANDARSTLTWNGRLTDWQNTSIYNFYSSGEEVLRDYPADPPTSLPTIFADEAAYFAEGEAGEYTWVWQEKNKGLMGGNWILSSDHGGWQFNEAYETNIIGDGFSYWEPMSPAAAAELTIAQLQTNAFFNFSAPPGSSFPFNNDLALETSSGSSYAQANRNRILSDAIPALTLPVGANYDTNLDVEFGNTRNFDMQLNYENGWPPGLGSAQYPPGTTAFGEWHHSDVRTVADPFTYLLFNQMVTLGNLQ